MLLGYEPKVYLAGNIAGETYGQATEWRDYAKVRLHAMGIAGLSPMRSTPNRWGTKRLTADCTGGKTEPDDKALKAKCHWDAERCDAILACFDGTRRISIGTVLEVAWGDESRKPVIGVLPDGDAHDHPLLRQSLTHRVYDLETAFEIIGAMFCDDVRAEGSNGN